MAITYDQRRPEIDDIIAIYQSSGIKRPVQDADRIREMYRHANLVITAWDGEKPVGIARALATEPRVLLCDEATSALDPETTQSILTLLADINTRLGLTIVLITHQMQVIKAIAHRVAVLDGGYLAEQGTVTDIFTVPKQAITRTLLSEVIGNEIPPGVRERASALVASGAGRIWRLAFKNDGFDRLSLTEISNRFNVEIKLLHGDIDEIQGVSFGSLVAAASGEASALEAAAASIKAHDIILEEVVL